MRKPNPFVEKLKLMKPNVDVLETGTQKERYNAFNAARTLEIKITTRPLIGKKGFEVRRVD